MRDSQLKQFVFVVLGLNIPFCVAGALASGSDGVVALPVSALAVVVPLSAAAIVTHHAGGSVRRLLKRGVEPARAHDLLWMVVAVATMPVVVIAAHAGAHARDPEPSAITLPAAGALFLVFLVSAYGEEIGWTAFASRRLLERHSVPATGLLVGALWAVWHAIPFVQTGNSWSWIVGQLAFTVAFRVLITAFYAASGTARTAVLLHASYNMAWTLLPLYWSAYDPGVLALLTALVALAAVAVLAPNGRLVPAAGEGRRP